jgi:hypothetical protein
MKILLAWLAVALVAGGASSQPSGPNREAELAQVLEGWRPAGPTVRCLNLRRATIVRVVNRTAIVFRLGGTLYVMRPSGGAEFLDRRDVLIARFGLYMCGGQSVEFADPYSGVRRLIRAGPFQPYRRGR